MTMTLPDGFLWGVAARRAPDRGRQLEQRLVGVGARARTRRASRCRATAATASTATPTTSRSSATSASARTASRSSGRASSPKTASSPVAALDYYRRVLADLSRERRRAARHVPSLHDAALDGRARRLGRARDRRQVRAVLREVGRAPRRPHRDGLHDQRAERRVDARLPDGTLPARARATSALYAQGVREPARRAHARVRRR